MVDAVLELNEARDAVDGTRVISTRSTEDDLEEVKKWFYIAVGVYGAVLLLVIGLLIGIYVWVNKISKKQQTSQERINETKIQTDYRISRPKINGSENAYKRFTLPPKQEDDINSDVFFGGSRNPLSQPTSLQRAKSFTEDMKPNQVYDGGRRKEDSNMFSPSGSDYYNNYYDRNKFTY